MMNKKNTRLIVLLVLSLLALVLEWPLGLPIVAFSLLYLGLQQSLPSRVVLSIVFSFALVSFYQVWWTLAVLVVMAGYFFCSRGGFTKLNSFYRILLAATLSPLVLSLVAGVKVSNSLVLFSALSLVLAWLLLWWLSKKMNWQVTKEQQHLG